MSATKWTPSEDQLAEFLDATKESVNRVRQVLIVMATASIIVFAAVWNTLEFSWMRWRDEVASSREVWASYHQDPAEKARWDTLKAKIDAGKADAGDKSRWAEWQKKFVAGERHAASTIAPIAQLRDSAKKYREALQGSVITVHIPFFGIVLDAHEAALLGGVTLWIIMMWLRLSLWRQCSNLQMMFLQAQAAGRLEFAYRLASMQQVLSIPPPTADGDHPSRPKYGAPPILFCLPVAVFTIVLINDLATFEVVVKGDKVIHGVLQIVFAGALFAALAYLTGRCLQLREESRAIWERYFARLPAG